MKIHEQEWTVAPGKTGVERGILAKGRGLVFSATTNATLGDTSLASAAPEMARALLALGAFGTEGGKAWHTHECWNTKRSTCLSSCLDAYDALRSAGVL